MSQSDGHAEQSVEGAAASDRLDSWKEIAAFLQRDVRTVQRWEKQAGLPVHRHAESRLRTAYAYRSELDAWWRAQRTVADAVSEHDDSAEPPRRSNRTRMARASLVGVGVLAFAWIAIVMRQPTDRNKPPGSTPLTVMLAGFEDQTGDPGFAALLEEHIGRALQAHPGIEPAAPTRVARVLRLMRRDPAARFTDAVGHEVALRDGRIAFTVGGRVHRADSRVFVDLAVSDPADGRICLSREWAGASQDEVLSRVTGEVDTLADRLIASGPPASAGGPLEQVTTESLAALRLYSAAVDAARRGQWAASELLARRAIAADERFASAYAWAAWSVRQQGRATEAQPLLDRARSLTGDVSDRESYVISGLHHTMLGEHQRAIAAFEALFRIQPDNRDALDLLIDAYVRAGRMKDATDLMVVLADRHPNDFHANVRAAHALTVSCHDEARGLRFVRRAQELASTPGARDRPLWAAWLAGMPVYRHWLAGETRAALDALAPLERSLGDRVGRERDAYASIVGFAYLALGRVEQAERAFWQAASPLRQLNLATLALTRQDERTARGWLSQIKEHAGVRPALFARAGLDRDAEQGLETFTSVEHADAVASVTRGLIASHRGQLERARTALRRGFDLLRASGEPEYFFAAEALAHIAHARGDTSRAIGYLSHVSGMRARTYGPSQWTAGYWIRLNIDLAEIYRSAGREQDAALVGDILRGVLSEGQWTFGTPNSRLPTPKQTARTTESKSNRIR
jgi:tetratricopeptide (TPR) repeat protein